MKHLTLMKLTTVFFIILFMSCFFEATNPLDSAYQGSYNFESNDTLPSQLEVLKEYRIRFNNNGTDKYWKFYCTFDPPIDTLIRNDSSMAYPPDTGSVCFVFKKTYKGRITLVAEQPNRTKTEMPLHKQSADIIVVNPYTIDGSRLAGIDDSVYLSVLYNGERVKPALSDTFVVDNNKALWSESILVKPTNKTTKSTTDYRVFIKRNNDTLLFPDYTISYSGYSPGILNFSKYNAADTLRLGGTAKFSVRLNNGGNYSGKHIYKITSGTTVLSIDTLNYIDSGSVQVITIDTLKDTLYSKIMLNVCNDDTLRDTMSLAGLTDLNIYPVLPVIDFRDSSTTVERDSTFKVDIKVNESMGRDSFHWSYQNIKDSVTTTPYIVIPPCKGIADTISVYLKRVYDFGGKKFEYISKPLTKIIHPISFAYKIQLISAEPSQIIAKCTETFQVSVTNGIVPVPDSLLTYSWIFPPSDSNYVKFVPKTPNGSSFAVTILDSIKLQKFYFSVKAKFRNGTDSTSLFKSKDITVRNYKPSLTLLTPDTSRNMSQDVSFKASDSNGIVGTVYYRFSDAAVSDDKSVRSVTPQSKKFTLYFKRNGTATVQAWAVDTSGFVSDTQTVKFAVAVITPQFPIKPDTVKATIGVAKTLHARLSSRLDSITYLWDRNGNGIFKESVVDTLTKDCDSISFTPLDSIPDTVFVQCLNKLNVLAPNPYTLIVVARRNTPEIDTLLVDTSVAKYDNDEFKIKTFVSDPDSNLTNVKITWSYNGGTDTLLCESIVKAPFKACSIDTSKKNNRYGTYKFTVIATDSKGNTSTRFITRTLLRGDPFVDSVTVEKKSYYVKKTVQVIITARDVNGSGRIDSVQFIKSKDSSVIETRRWPDSVVNVTVFKPFITLKDTGSQYIWVKVFDNDGNPSIIKSTAFPISVLPHTPSILSVPCDETVPFNNKQLYFTINATDAFDTNSLKYFVSFSDSTHYTECSSRFSHTFTNAGINRFFVKVMDADSFYVVRQDSISIHDGKPVFVSGIDQTVNNWTNDENTFTFKCSDPNGTVDKLEINWGDGTTGSAVRTNNNGIFLFQAKKTFRNVNKRDSTYRITLTATDNDAMTAKTTDSVTIKQGRPILRPSFGNDSTIISGKYNPSNAELPCLLSVHAADVNPNGSILKYYWFLSRDSSSLESANWNSTDSTYELKNIPTNLVNTIYTTVTVIVMDDDSNLVAKKFNVYIDGPPPVPVQLDPVNGTKSFAKNAVVTFEWTGHDVHDSLATKFSIFVRLPGSNDFTLIQNPAITVDMVGNVPHFKYNFTNTSLSGSYSWKVVATDQLGSVTSSDANLNTSFVILTQ